MIAEMITAEHEIIVPPSMPETAITNEVSVIIVSFNTRNLLRECLQSIEAEASAVAHEIIVVDNASKDGSPEMVAEEFPRARLIRSEKNLGFGNANNVALEQANARYIVLLNSDAFLAKGALARAIAHMDAEPNCAMGGGLLVGRDGEHQPSARCFHTVSNDALVLTGLAGKFPRSKFFGRFDRTWADPMQPASVDWVPGAFAIVRPSALKRVGLFDPDFFLYYEEVNLCHRLHNAGYSVWYWPDVVITHIGGESSRQLKTHAFSTASAQVALWRMRSTLLYYRKHQGSKVKLAYGMERSLYGAAALRNSLSSSPYRRDRKQYFLTLRKLLKQAWQDTNGGRISPPQPW